MQIKKGDEVKILVGKDRGKTGKVLRLLPDDGRVIVEGRNIFVRHQRPKKSGEKGQKIQVARPMHLSNVMLVCPHCGKPTRSGVALDEKGIKSRVCKKCGKRI